MNDRRVDAYIERSAEFAKPVLRHLRQTIHKGCPEVRETIKWGFPHFDHHGIMCSMAAFKEHCSFGFWKASRIRDPHQVMERKDRGAMGNFGRITTMSDLPSRSTLLALVKQAAALNEQGTPRRRTVPKPKKKLSIPRYFLSAVEKNARAFRTFSRLSPSGKREYVEWVTEAKTEGTRSKRLAMSVKWMSEGKQRNWKYMKKR